MASAKIPVIHTKPRWQSPLLQGEKVLRETEKIVPEAAPVQASQGQSRLAESREEYDPNDDEDGRRVEENLLEFVDSHVSGDRDDIKRAIKFLKFEEKNRMQESRAFNLVGANHTPR